MIKGVIILIKSAKNTGSVLFVLKLLAFILAFIAVFFLLYRTAVELNNKQAFPGGNLREMEKVTFTGARNLEVITVILDAGHGGIDSGAISPDGIEEKILNLPITEKIAEFLSLYQVDVILTRDDDRLLGGGAKGSVKRSDLVARVKTTEQYENPIFLSIHMNKFSIPKYSGLHVFYSRNNPQSEALALKVQNMVKEKLQPINNRVPKVAGSNIFVLDRVECPAILIECGFLSNYEETRLLASEDYQRKLAFVISLSIMEYLSL